MSSWLIADGWVSGRVCRDVGTIEAENSQVRYRGLCSGFSLEFRAAMGVGTSSIYVHLFRFRRRAYSNIVKAMPPNDACRSNPSIFNMCRFGSLFGVALFDVPRIKYAVHRRLVGPRLLGPIGAAEMTWVFVVWVRSPAPKCSNSTVLSNLMKFQHLAIQSMLGS